MVCSKPPEVQRPVWHPDVFARRAANLAARQRILAALRTWFAAENFAEVETPILQVSPGNEVHLQTFATQLTDPHRDTAPQTLHLHTSPEFAMKKLLVAGVPRLYQLARVFRNGELSARHHPEFLMLEWYRANADTQEIMWDCIGLLRAVAQAAGCTHFTADGTSCDPFRDWETLSVPEAFRHYADIDLLATIADPYAPTPGTLATEAARIGLRVMPDDSWGDLFFRIMGERIEPFLGHERPTFLCDYPVNQAALARPKPNDPRLAERFELYVCGVELANAFGELTDAAEQERRFHADNDLREKLYGTRAPIDEDFLTALRYGMPESAGIALGVDRLVMLATGAERIEDVLWLPVMTAVE